MIKTKHDADEEGQARTAYAADDERPLSDLSYLPTLRRNDAVRERRKAKRERQGNWSSRNLRFNHGVIAK